MKCLYTKCQNFSEFHYPLCIYHCILVYNVFISKSKIKNADLGLFSGPNGFHKNQIIGIYGNNSNKTRQKDLLHVFGYKRENWKYILCENNEISDNNICWTGHNSYTKYINDSYKTSFINNAYFDYVKSDNTVYVKAKKFIHPYEEILLDYGSRYWNG